MSGHDEALVGVESCGCITYANARPDDIDRTDHEAIGRIIAGGGEVRRVTVDEARAMPNFLVSECPHDPKGWERDRPRRKEPHERLRYQRNPGRNLSIVNVVIERGTCGPSYWPKGLRGGEVGKRDGKWWATPGWLDSREAKANNGGHPRASAEVLGPFTTQREAALALVPYAEARARALGQREVDS